jgi:hypothetical protein
VEEVAGSGVLRGSGRMSYVIFLFLRGLRLGEGFAPKAARSRVAWYGRRAVVCFHEEVLPAEGNRLKRAKPFG